MLNTPWETGSPLYRKLLVSALATTGLGILLALVAAVTGADALFSLALPVIAVGLVTHVAGVLIRLRDTRRRHSGNR